MSTLSYKPGGAAAAAAALILLMSTGLAAQEQPPAPQLVAVDAAKPAPQPLPQPRLPPPPSLEDWSTAVDQQLPMTPEMVQELKRYNEAVERAKHRRTNPLKAEKCSRQVTLDPGSPIPEIDLDVDSVTAISFYDLTGAHWPVLNFVHNPIFYQVSNPVEGGSSIVITPVAMAAPGNIAVYLQGEPRPVMIRLKANEGDVVHYQCDLRILARGPNERLDPILVSTPDPAGDAVIMQFLQGVPPAGAVPVRGGDVPGFKAWRYQGQVYLRTAHTPLAPQPVQQVAFDGVAAYQLPDTPMVLVSVDGSETTIPLP